MKRLFSRLRGKSDERNRVRPDPAAGSPATYVGDNRILLRLDIGEHRLIFYVEADDRLITPGLVTSGIYDLGSTNYLLGAVASGDHCVDVGANFGYFTCLMAKLAHRGKVTGIEADERIATLAHDNVLINDLHEIAEIRHAAANATGEDMHLFRRNTRSGNTSIISYGTEFTDFMQETAEEQFAVRGLRIDDMLPGFTGRIDFLKIDVEGAEPLVFDGAREAIATNPQMRIIMEWSPGQMRKAGFDIAELLATLEAMGLKAWTLADGLRPVSFGEVLNLPYQAGLFLARDAA